MTTDSTVSIVPDLEQVALLYDNNHVPFALIECAGGSDAPGIIRYVNSALAALFDISRESVINKCAITALSIQSPSLISAIEGAFAGRKHVTYAEISTIRKFCEFDILPLGCNYCGCLIEEVGTTTESGEHWLKTYYRKVLELISSVVDVRSSEVGAHICRMRGYTETLCRAAVPLYPEFNIDERMIRAISEASVLHDVGKIGISDSILLKPATLTSEEFDEMKHHTEIGGQIAERLADFATDRDVERYAYDICRYHHERYDGNGYPDRLSGETIPLCSQIVAIADAYDALTTSRIYKPAYDPDRAYEMIINGDCGVFSPRMLKCLESVRDEFARISVSYSGMHDNK